MPRGGQQDYQANRLIPSVQRAVSPSQLYAHS